MVQGSLMFERQRYQVNRPQLGGKDAAKKWRNTTDKQIQSLFEMCFPMTKEGRNKIEEHKKSKAQRRKERLREIRNS